MTTPRSFHQACFLPTVLAVDTVTKSTGTVSPQLLTNCRLLVAASATQVLSSEAEVTPPPPIRRLRHTLVEESVLHFTVVPTRVREVTGQSESSLGRPPQVTLRGLVDTYAMEPGLLLKYGCWPGTD